MTWGFDDGWYRPGARGLAGSIAWQPVREAPRALGLETATDGEIWSRSTAPDVMATSADDVATRMAAIGSPAAILALVAVSRAQRWLMTNSSESANGRSPGLRS